MACPICNKPTAARFRPFCSVRCADVDLAHWLRGDYRLSADEPEDMGCEAPETDTGIFVVDSRDRDG